MSRLDEELEEWRRGVRFGFLLGVLSSGAVAFAVYLFSHLGGLRP